MLNFEFVWSEMDREALQVKNERSVSSFKLANKGMT